MGYFNQLNTDHCSKAEYLCPDCYEAAYNAWYDLQEAIATGN